MKLTDNQKIFLIMVDDNTSIDWTTGKLNHFWVPPAGDRRQWCETFGASVFIHGAGDANTLAALQARKLIDWQRLTKYAASITEAGHKAAEDLRADRDELERLTRMVRKADL